MRHDLTLAGPAFRLRPITDADAPLVLELRSDTRRNRYLHPIPPRLDDQLAWFARYYERPGDYYFVVERQDSGAAEGVISLYDVDLKAGCGEWGRWILRPGSLAAVESAWLIYRCAFEQLGLKRVFCHTVADNVSVVSFHDSCGITEKRLLPNHFNLGGRPADAVEHEVTREAWSAINLRLQKLAELAARKLRRGCPASGHD
jgi:RimJ/RimL family protein N-acetyltransferase